MSSENEQKAQGEIGGNETMFDGSNNTAIQVAANDATQLKVDKSLLGENLYEFWFGPDAEKDIREVLGDCISRTKWEGLLTKFREGSVSSDEVIDALLLSHMTVLNEETQNPFATSEEIMDRAIESKFKGKLGRKLIANTIDALAESKLLTTNPDALKALVDQSITKSDERVDSQKQNQLLIPDLKQAMPAIVDHAFEKYMKSIAVADQIRDISSGELVARLSEPEDPYFSPVHHLVFDIGWEAPSRLKAEERCLALYVAELDRAWVDEASSNVKTSDRRITRYLVRDLKRGETEKLDKVLTALMTAYKGRLEEKATFITVLWERGL